MQKIVLITDVNFWAEGAGHRMRILRLVQYLASTYDLTIIYIGNCQGYDKRALEEYLNVELIFLEENGPLDKEDQTRILGRLFSAGKYRLCIIEFIHLSYCLRSLPEETVTILDAHDIINERSDDFIKFNYPLWGYHINKDLEYKLFGLFDYVMVICDVDYEKIKSVKKEQPVILAPHPVDILPHKLRPSVHNIAFIASEYTPNVDAIEYFLKNIWSRFVPTSEIHLNIFGNVAHKISNGSFEKVRLRGFVNNLAEAYNEADIIINPVRFGAGLKIKNVEALANGIPLVTTTHGSRGMEEAKNIAYLQADDDESFLAALYELVNNPLSREMFSKAALKYAAKKFSAQTCFAELDKIINDC